MTDSLVDWERSHPAGAGPPPPVGAAARRLELRGRILDWAQILALVLPTVLAAVIVLLAFRIDHRASKVADTVAAFRQLVLCKTPADCAKAKARLEDLGPPTVIVIPGTSTTSGLPLTTTTSTTVPAPNRSPLPAPVAPAGRATTTSTSQPLPPTTAAPAPSQPAPATTSTTACPNRILGRCAPSLP